MASNSYFHAMGNEYRSIFMTLPVAIITVFFTIYSMYTALSSGIQQEGIFLYFIALSLVISIYFLLSNNEIAPLLRKQYTIILIFFFIYCIIMIFIKYINDNTLIYSQISILHFSKVLFIDASCFLAAYTFRANTPKMRIVTFGYLLGLTMSIIFLTTLGVTIVNQAFNDVISYQVIARNLLIISLAYICTLKNPLHVYSASIISLSAIFLLGARSEFVGLAVAIFAISLLDLKKSPAKTAITLLFFGVLGGLLFSSFFSDSRIAELMNLEESSSWAERTYLRSAAISEFLKNPIFGNLEAHIGRDGSASKYSHDIISAFAGLGLVGGSLFLALLLWPIIYIIHNNDGVFNHTPQFRLAIMLCSATLVMHLASKSIFDIHAAFAWGVFARFLVERDRLLRRSGQYDK